VYQVLIRDDVALNHIFRALRVPELSRCSRVCKKWKHLLTARLVASKTKAIPKLVDRFAFGDGGDSAPPNKSTAALTKQPQSTTIATAGTKPGSNANSKSVASTTTATTKSVSSPSTVTAAGDASSDLDAILDDPHRANAFILYCKTSLCDEYLGFYLAVQSYKELAPGSQKQLAAAHGLVERFIRPDAEQEVGIPQPLREKIMIILAANPLPPDTPPGTAATTGTKSTPSTAVASKSNVAPELSLTPSTFDIVQRHVLNLMRGMWGTSLACVLSDLYLCIA
jgi:hypothetical protein